ncbi:MAG: hypothetical protein ACI4AQ_03370 [Lachnospiraceae bacterium]
MADLVSISKDICKDKNVDRNLPLYLDNMSTLYSRFSYIKLAMNYYTFYDMIADAQDDVTRSIVKVLGSFNGIMEENLVHNSGKEDLENAVTRLMSIRESVTDTMDVVAAYVDRFTLYEYILNRIEHRFDDNVLDEDYYENRLANDIMRYILSDKDTVVMNGKIAEVVGQLPMRLTRKKFMELVKDAFSLYKGQDLSSLADFVYMLKSNSGIYEPEHMKEMFPDLFEILEHLKSYSYKEMDHDGYQKAYQELQYAVSFVTRTSDLYVSLMEIINDLLTILLLKNRTYMDTVEREQCIFILKNVMSCKEEGLTDDAAKDVTDCFIAFEGSQERIYSMISSNDYVLDEIKKSHMDIVAQMGLSVDFENLLMASRLSSGSNFVSLKNSEETGVAGEEDVEKAFSEYAQAMEECFKISGQIQNRAVMANVLSTLPVFFNNVNEIMSYIQTSLSQCSDMAEKKACVEIFTQMLEEY